MNRICALHTTKNAILAIPLFDARVRKLLHFFVLMIVECALLSHSIAFASTAKETMMAQADAAVDRKQWAVALQLLTPWLDTNPEDEDVRFLLARTLAWQGNLAAALVQYASLLDKNPDNTDYLLAQGQTLAWQGQKESALEVLRRARDIAPHYHDIWWAEFTLRSGMAQAQDLLQAFATEYQKQFPGRAPLVFAKTEAEQSERWSVGGVFSVERPSNQPLLWTERLVFVTNSQPHTRGLVLEARNINRYGLSDSSLSATLSITPMADATFSLIVGGATEHTLLPRSVLGGRAEWSPRTWISAGVDYQNTVYSNASNDRTRADVGVRVGKWEFQLREAFTLVNLRDQAWGTDAAITWNATPQWRAIVAAAKGVELEVDERSVLHQYQARAARGGLVYAIPSGVELSMQGWVATQDAASRSGGAVGITYRR